MTKGVFVTGTGTDIGKTYVSALLVKALAETKGNVGYFKGALSGVELEQCKMVSGDPKTVCDMAGLADAPESLVSYLYETPVSPHLAAKMEGKPISMEEIEKGFSQVCQTHDFVVVEGSGGMVCPLRYDEETLLLTDVMRMTGFPLLVVADAGLGTINHTVLTIAYGKSQGFLIAGVILNRYDPKNEMHRDNKTMIEALTGVSVVACVEKGAAALHLPSFL